MIETLYKVPINNELTPIEKIQHPFGVTSRSPDEKIAKQIVFPASPAFTNNYYLHKQPKLARVSEEMAKKNIPFNLEEKTFYKIKQEKQRFKQFAYSINTCFETGRPSFVEAKINAIRDFDKKVYMPLAADPVVTSKIRKAISNNGRGLPKVPCSFYKSEDAPREEDPPLKKGQLKFPQGIQDNEIKKILSVDGRAKLGTDKIKQAFNVAERNKREILESLRHKLEAPITVNKDPVQEGKKRRKKKQSPDPLQRIFKVNGQVYRFSKKMNAKVIKILERYELDKPITIADKLDIIWDKAEGKFPKSLIEERDRVSSQTPDKPKKIASPQKDCSAKRHSNDDKLSVKKMLTARKIERRTLNGDQIKAYKKLIDFLTNQRTADRFMGSSVDPSYSFAEESIREFMDAIRLILQSGYFIEQADFIELVSMIDVQEKAKTGAKKLKVYAFFSQAAELFRFDVKAVQQAFDRVWNENEPQRPTALENMSELDAGATFGFETQSMLGVSYERK